MAISQCGLSLLLLFLSLSIAKCEFFTALIDLKHLIYRERELKNALKNYIALEEERLASLKKFSEKVENIHKTIPNDDIEGFLGHPVNSYLIIKRFYSEWTKVEELTQKDSSEEIMEAIEKHKSDYSSKEDVDGAITALLRLQDTYRMPTRSMAEGKLQNARPMPPMSVDDCYQIGRHAYLSNDMFYTKVWMEEALRKMKMNEPTEGVLIFDVFDHLAYAEFQRGNLRKALNYTLEMVRLDPQHQRALDNVRFFGGEIKKTKLTGLRGETGKVPTPMFKSTSERDHLHRTKAFQNYEKLCRGEIRNLTKWEKSKMKCWHVNNDPLTIIKPARMERVFVKPEIFIIRDVISDSEIKHIKQLATPRLFRATVALDDGTLESTDYRISKSFDEPQSSTQIRLRRATIQHPVTGNLEFAKYRISKSGWLKDEEDARVRQISKRIQAITGLNMSTAEELQVVNYGIGGHYEPHYDFAREGEDKFTSLGTGNRIATFLAYLSDVQAGGGTVFTRVGTVVWPSKGDAAFWYNLKKNGDGDDSTRHAACPVLIGSKWVANKWIHELGQEFRRKCSLNPYE